MTMSRIYQAVLDNMNEQVYVRDLNMNILFDPFFSDKFEGNGGADRGPGERQGITRLYHGGKQAGTGQYVPGVFLPVAQKQGGEGERDGAVNGEQTKAS